MFSPVSTQLLSISPLLYLLSSQVLPQYVIHPNFNLFPTSLSQSSLFSSLSPLLCCLLSSQSCLGTSSIRTLTFFQQVDPLLFSSPSPLRLLSLATSCPHRPASVCHPFELQPFLNKFITVSSLLLSIS